MSDNRYDDTIIAAANRYGVPVGMIKGLIKVESNWNPNADSGYSVGLMQVTPSTAGLTRSQLLDPVTNIYAGTKHLAGCFSRRRNWTGALSEYNGGYRPEIGYGAPYSGTKTIRVCNAWKANAPKTGRVLDRDCLPGSIVTVYPGQYANQAYVDKILRWYGEYAQEGTTTPETPRVDMPVSATPPTTATPKMVALILGVIGTILGLGRLRGGK